MQSPLHQISLVPLVVLGLMACSADMADDTAVIRQRDVARTVGYGQGETIRQVCFPGEFSDDSSCFSLKSVDGSISGYHYPNLDDARYPQPVAYLDLFSVRAETWIAPSFQLWELAQSWKGRWAIIQPRAVLTLQAMRDDIGPMAIYSGYRSPSYNRTVNGKHTSRHMYGDGFDFSSIQATRQELAQVCRDHGASYVEVYSTHVHCDWRDDANEAAFFGANEDPDPYGDDNNAPHGARTTGPTPEDLGRNAAIMDNGALLNVQVEGFDEGEPLIEWTAHDEQGAPLETWEGAEFAPPIDTATVMVRVGGVLTRTRALD